MRIKPLFKNIEKCILTELGKANSEIKIAVTWFTSRKLYNVLLDKAKEGKDCSVVILNDKINRESSINWQKFILAGGKLFFPKEEIVVHHKFMVIDRLTVISGSYNWTVNAENKNFENVLRMEETGLAQIFSDEFSRICSFCYEITNLNDHVIQDYSFIREEIAKVTENNKTGKQLKKTEPPQVRDRAIMHHLGTYTWWDVIVDEISDSEYCLSWKLGIDPIDDKTELSAGMRIGKDDTRFVVLKYSEDYIKDKKLFRIPVNLPL